MAAASVEARLILAQAIEPALIILLKVVAPKQKKKKKKKTVLQEAETSLRKFTNVAPNRRYGRRTR